MGIIKGRVTLTPPSLLLDNHHDGISARGPPFILKHKGSTLKGKGLLSYRPERGCQTGFETHKYFQGTLGVPS